MKIFVVTLFLMKVCHFFAARMCRNFNGASRNLYHYLLYSAGIGTILVYATFGAAIYVATWWMPIAAFALSILAVKFVPYKFEVEIVFALLWPVFFIATVVLMIVNV